jgi:DNA polymerase-4
MLRLRFDDFSRASRSHTLSRATCATEIILSTVRALLAAALPMIHNRGVTLIGIAVGNFDGGGAVQLMLPFAGYPANAIDTVLDDIHDRFGSTSITRAVLLGRDPGLQMPMLPD